MTVSDGQGVDRRRVWSPEPAQRGRQVDHGVLTCDDGRR